MKFIDRLHQQRNDAKAELEAIQIEYNEITEKLDEAETR